MCGWVQSYGYCSGRPFAGWTMTALGRELGNRSPGPMEGQECGEKGEDKLQLPAAMFTSPRLAPHRLYGPFQTVSRAGRPFKSLRPQEQDLPTGTCLRLA